MASSQKIVALIAAIFSILLFLPIDEAIVSSIMPNDLLLFIAAVFSNVVILGLLIGVSLGVGRADWKKVSLGIVSAYAVTWVIKVLIARSRPFGMEEILLGIPDYSFPSGHATLVFSIIPFIREKRMLHAWVILAVIVSVSRVILHAHYPSDVIAGAIIGLGVGWGVKHVIEQSR